jgi:hypothetical protein
MRRKRYKLFESTLKVIREGIDKYEQCNMQEIGYLKSYQAQLEDGWKRFQFVQGELDDLDEERRRSVKKLPFPGHSNTNLHGEKSTINHVVI